MYNMKNFNKNHFLLLTLLTLGISFSSCNSSSGKDNISEAVQNEHYDQLARLPPMGWNSWNVFGKNINEKVIMETADAFVSTGLRDLGYEYLVIDDIWHGGRDSTTGILFEDPVKFPSGMKALADYVHSKGLKFGIYSDAGTKTCGEMPGSFGFEKQDAQLFADWGVDFLKYDYCYVPELVSLNNDYKMAIDRYKAMGDALKATGRPILFSICEWGPRSPWLWGKEVGGHMWRTSYDVADIWDTPRNETSPIGILTSIDAMANLGRFSGPGGWNDPDMLVVGLNNTGFIKGGGCNEIEYRTQMNMWCMFAAPIMIGCDVRDMNEETKTILLNKDIIAIDQDSLGKQGFRVFSKDGLEAWKKPLSNGRFAIALFNRNSQDKTISANWKELELDPNTRFDAYDVWKHEVTGVELNKISANLKPHESHVFVFTPSKSK